MRLRKAQFVWPPQQHKKCKTALTFGCVIYTSLMLTINVNIAANAGTVCWSRSADTVCDVNQIPQIVNMPLLPRSQNCAGLNAHARSVY